MTPKELLRYMAQVEEWAKSGDERAKKYIDADAVRVDEQGVVSFHRDRFLSILASTEYR